MSRAYYNAAQSALRSASKHILQNMDRIDRVRFTPDPDNDEQVSSVALAVEREIAERIQTLYPSHSLLCKHAGLIRAEIDDPSEQYHWVLDPLDGATNFISGIPYFCISLALFHNRRCVLALVYQPVSDELFSASIGESALLNGKKLRARKAAYQTQSLVMLAGQTPVNEMVSELETLSKHELTTSNIRLIGSVGLGLCYHAMGACDVFFAQNISICEAAAGLLIASEAGTIIKKSQKSDHTIDRVISLITTS